MDLSNAAVDWKVSIPNFLPIHHRHFVQDYMIKCHFPVHPVATQAHDVPPLGYQESNALRYAAGCVPQAIRKRVERGSHPLKEELVLCHVKL